MTIKRPNYTTGQLLTASDFQDEQDYHRNQCLRHNQSLHTPGVCTGLVVTMTADAMHATVSPGSAIDADGQEIVLDAQATIDATGMGKTPSRYCVAIRARAFADPLDNLSVNSTPFCTRTSEGSELVVIDCAYNSVNSSYQLPAPDVLKGAIPLAVLCMNTGTIFLIDDVHQSAGALVSSPLSMPLGIGVANPQASLVVNRNLGSFSGAAIVLGNTGSNQTFFRQGNDDGYLELSWGSNGQRAGIEVGSGKPLVIQANQGNVGIGNINPKGNLHIGSTDPNTPNPNLFINGDTTNGEKGMRLHYNHAFDPKTLLPNDIGVIDVRGNRFALRGTNQVSFPAVGTTPANSDAGVERLAIDLVTGDVSIPGHLIVGGAKSGYVVDQFVNRVGAPLELGDVVVIGAEQPAFHYGVRDSIPVPEVDYASGAYDTRLCGIVCEVRGELVEAEATAEEGKKKPKAGKPVLAKLSLREFSGAEKQERDHATVQHGQVGFMVTLGAFAHCKVDADIAPIVAGDLLTTSPTPGHAQKVLDRSQAIGAIVGKALAPLKKGKGRIPVMVMMQ